MTIEGLWLASVVLLGPGGIWEMRHPQASPVALPGWHTIYLPMVQVPVHSGPLPVVATPFWPDTRPTVMPPAYRDCVITVQLDDSSNGSVESITTKTVDSHGSLVREEARIQGEEERRLVAQYQYAQPDQILEASEDLDGDGRVDSRTTYGYDDRGNQVSWTHDTGADGTPDLRHVLTYASDNYLLGDEGDVDGDGRVDERITYAYDGLGKPYLIVDDWDGDGTPEHALILRYQGLQATNSLDYDPVAQQILSERVAELDDAGRVAVVIAYIGPERSFRERGEFTYDGGGRLSSARWRNSAGEQRSIEMSYDDVGRLVSVDTMDFAGQQSSTRVTYVCAEGTRE